MTPPIQSTLPGAATDVTCLRLLSRDDLHRESQLSLFQRVLLVTDGSVTELLSLYTKGAIRAHKLTQSESMGPLPAPLGGPGVSPHTAALHREIMLMDGQTPLVFAASVFVLDALSPTTRAGLLESEVPIGLLWKAEKSEMYREIVDMRLETHPTVAARFGLPTATPLLSRSYTLHQAGQPMGLITEKFPATSFQN